jgi:hypothetical protein
MVAPPVSTPLTILSDDNSKPHASTLVAILALLAKLKHAGLQFVARQWSPF